MNTPSPCKQQNKQKTLQGVNAASSGTHTRWWKEQASSLALSRAPVCGVRRLSEGSRRDTGGVSVTKKRHFSVEYREGGACALFSLHTKRKEERVTKPQRPWPHGDMKTPSPCKKQNKRKRDCVDNKKKKKKGRHFSVLLPGGEGVPCSLCSERVINP